MITDPMADYRRIQRRFVMFTLALSLGCLPLVAIRFSSATVMSFVIGCIAGLLYLVLLSRSVAKLSTKSRRFGRVQLLVPTLLVLLSAHWSLYQLIPALIGFLIYKPAVILSTALELRGGDPGAKSTPKPSNA